MSVSLERLVEILSKHDCNPRQSGNDWSCLCPAHEDTNPSLSIAEGDNGKVLVHCFSGCSIEDICRELGIKARDLMPDNGWRPSYKPIKAARRNVKEPVKGIGWPSFDDLLANVKSAYGMPDQIYEYHDADGETIGAVIRWDRQNGKQIRQYALIDGQWHPKAMPEPRPLYQLQSVLAAETIYVVEGEKCVEALTSLGLAATTSAGGSQAANKADWSPLAGKRVVVLPDADEPGRKYANDVCGLLDGVAQSIRVVELKSLEGETPKGFDIYDCIQEQRQLTPDSSNPELVAKLQSLCEQAESLEAEPQEDEPQANEWTPFPVHALPEPLRSFVTEGSAAFGCDQVFLALPMLVMLASCVGTYKTLRLKDSWLVRSILWGAIIAESGSVKSPAFKAAMKPLREIEADEHENFRLQVEFHRLAMTTFNMESKKWEKKPDGDPPRMPEPVTGVRHIVRDCTFESLAPILEANPRGILLERDELAGWLASFNQYKGGKGSDSANWLSSYNAEDLLIDRRHGNPPTVFVPNAAISVIGTIQPEIFAGLMGPENRKSGMLARFLVCSPPKRRRRWSEDVITESTMQAVAKVVHGLLQLEKSIVSLSPQAKAEWVAFYDDFAIEQESVSGDLVAAFAKLEEIPARIALVLHCVSHAVNPAHNPYEPDVMSAETMRAGITIGRWFTNEARRVYMTLAETPKDGESRKLVEWIQRQGGEASLRDIQRGFSVSKRDAETLLNELVTSGQARWLDRQNSRGPKSKRVALR